MEHSLIFKLTSTFQILESVHVCAPQWMLKYFFCYFEQNILKRFIRFQIALAARLQIWPTKLNVQIHLKVKGPILQCGEISNLHCGSNSRQSVSVTRLGEFFCKFGYFWKLILKRSSPQNGLLFTKAIFFHFHLNKKFQNMVCCRCFKVSKVSNHDVDVLDFQI